MTEIDPLGKEKMDLGILPAERAIESPNDDVLDRDSFVARLSRVLISDTTKRASGTVVRVESVEAELSEG